MFYFTIYVYNEIPNTFSGISMKSILILLVAGLFSFSTFAKIETSSFKTTSNQTVALGDSLAQLMSRTGQSPSAMRSTPWLDGSNTVYAMQYDYNIGDNVYTVTVVKEQIRKIEMKSYLQ